MGGGGGLGGGLSRAPTAPFGGGGGVTTRRPAHKTIGPFRCPPAASAATNGGQGHGAASGLKGRFLQLMGGLPQPLLDPPIAPHDLHRDSLYEVQSPTVTLKNSWDLRSLERRSIMGLQGLLWTETMRTWDVVEYQLFPRAVAIAEAAWLPQEHLDRAPWEHFLRRLEYHKDRLRHRGVRYYAGDYTGT